MDTVNWYKRLGLQCPAAPLRKVLSSDWRRKNFPGLGAYTTSESMAIMSRVMQKVDTKWGLNSTLHPCHWLLFVAFIRLSLRIEHAMELPYRPQENNDAARVAWAFKFLKVYRYEGDVIHV